MKDVLDFSHELIEQSVNPGDHVVDGTCGNGHDTLFLAQLVGAEGHVYGFDIQEQAITNTRNRLESHQLDERVSLFLQSHSTITDHVPFPISAAIYNLGYLPGSDKTVVTVPKETIQSIEQALSILKPQGILVLVVYYGHPGGSEEKEALLEYASTLDNKKYRVLQYRFINQRNTPPFIIAIRKQA